MADELILPAKISYNGGDADKHVLDFYDGTQSLFGFAKAIKISTHYLINQKVVFHATATRGVRVVMLPSRSGSWEQVIRIIIENPEITIAGALINIGSSAFWDFTKYIFGMATGRYSTLKNRKANKIIEKNGDIDALVEAIDGPLLDAHRTIAENKDSFIKLIEGRTEVLLFNKESHKFLNTKNISDCPEDRRVNVASYNVNSGSGRVFDYDLGRTVPFEPEKGHKYDPSALTWSLDRQNRGIDGTIIVSVRKITTIDDKIKKFILSDCHTLNP